MLKSKQTVVGQNCPHYIDDACPSLCIPKNQPSSKSLEGKVNAEEQKKNVTFRQTSYDQPNTLSLYRSVISPFLHRQNHQFAAVQLDDENSSVISLEVISSVSDLLQHFVELLESPSSCLWAHIFLAS